MFAAPSAMAGYSEYEHQRINRPDISQPPPPEPAYILPNGEVLNPLCFVNNLADNEDTPIRPTSRCANERIVADPSVEVPLDPTSHISAFFYIDDPDTPDETDEHGRPIDLRYPGFVGYHYLGNLQGFHLFVIVENGGGSGVFSSLALYELTRNDMQEDVLKLRTTIASGDRCNGGVARAQILPDEQIQFEQSITPYDMLVLGGDPERPFLETVDAYEDLDACAACCYGTAIYKAGAFDGVKFNDTLAEFLHKNSGDENYTPDQEKQKCFDKLVLAHLDRGKLRFTPAEWYTFINHVEYACLGRTDAPLP
jgi:hypothetical protein